MNLLTAILIGVVAVNACSALRVVCYYGTWSVYRHGLGKFKVEDIDPHVCTHLIVSFVGINTDGTVRILDAWNEVGDEWHEGAFTKLQKLKTKNPNLKILLAMGGWNEGSIKYSNVAKEQRLRNNLVNSVVAVVKAHKFDGFDFDWEYPTQRGGARVDRDNFSRLLREFRQRFNQERLLLTAAVSANPVIVDHAYDVPVLSENLDFINLMTYDIHGGWDPFTGHNAPVRAGPKDLEIYGNAINVEDTVKHWLSRGCNPQKINLGLATYGRSFTLTNSNNFGVGARARGKGSPGKFVNEAGFLGYNEICYEQNRNLWRVFRDKIGKVPYAVKGDQWVGYDDAQSITDKVNLALYYRLGGAMFWSVETDDFANICGKGKYPLLKAALRALKGTSTWQPPSQTISSPLPKTWQTSSPQTPSWTTLQPPSWHLSSSQAPWNTPKSTWQQASDTQGQSKIKAWAPPQKSVHNPVKSHSWHSPSQLPWNSKLGSWDSQDQQNSISKNWGSQNSNGWDSSDSLSKNWDFHNSKKNYWNSQNSLSKSWDSPDTSKSWDSSNYQSKPWHSQGKPKSWNSPNMFKSWDSQDTSKSWDWSNSQSKPWDSQYTSKSWDSSNSQSKPWDLQDKSKSWDSLNSQSKPWDLQDTSKSWKSLNSTSNLWDSSNFLSKSWKHQSQSPQSWEEQPMKSSTWPSPTTKIWASWTSGAENRQTWEQPSTTTWPSWTPSKTTAWSGWSTTTQSPFLFAPPTRPADTISINYDRVQCNSNGELIADPENCSKFYQCLQVSLTQLKAAQFSCRPGLKFDRTISSCNYADRVTC